MNFISGVWERQCKQVCILGYFFFSVGGIFGCEGQFFCQGGQLCVEGLWDGESGDKVVWFDYGDGGVMLSKLVFQVILFVVYLQCVGGVILFVVDLYFWYYLDKVYVNCVLVGDLFGVEFLLWVVVLVDNGEICFDNFVEQYVFVVFQCYLWLNKYFVYW